MVFDSLSELVSHLNNVTFQDDPDILGFEVTGEITGYKTRPWNDIVFINFQLQEDIGKGKFLKLACNTREDRCRFTGFEGSPKDGDKVTVKASLQYNRNISILQADVFEMRNTGKGDLLLKFQEIKDLFAAAGVENFERLPEAVEERAMFAKLFRQFNSFYEAARIQGFTWVQDIYQVPDENGELEVVRTALTETTYLILALRYKELFTPGGSGNGREDIPYEIDTYLTEINTDRIDAEYMQSRFEKYLRLLNSATDEAEMYKALAELHKSFATLSNTEQIYANQILMDIQTGTLIIDGSRTLRDYLNEYAARAKNDRIHRFAVNFGVNEDTLRHLMDSNPTATNLNEFGRFDQLIDTVDKDQAQAFIEALEGEAVVRRRLNGKIYNVLRAFLIGHDESLVNIPSVPPAN